MAAPLAARATTRAPRGSCDEDARRSSAGAARRCRLEVGQRVRAAQRQVASRARLAEQARLRGGELVLGPAFEPQQRPRELARRAALVHGAERLLEHLEQAAEIDRFAGPRSAARALEPRRDLVEHERAVRFDERVDVLVEAARVLACLEDLSPKPASVSARSGATTDLN